MLKFGKKTKKAKTLPLQFKVSKENIHYYFVFKIQGPKRMIEWDLGD